MSVQNISHTTTAACCYLLIPACCLLPVGPASLPGLTCAPPGLSRPPGPAGREDSAFWKNVIDFLESKAVLPCVIFTFGKFKCEACGYGLTSTDLTTKSEKAEIENFVNSSVRRLRFVNTCLSTLVCWTASWAPPPLPPSTALPLRVDAVPLIPPVATVVRPCLSTQSLLSPSAARPTDGSPRSSRSRSC